MAAGGNSAIEQAKPLKPFRRFHREHVRDWSELFSLCLNSSETSSNLALQCVEQLLKDVSIESNRLARLQCIANRNKMNWTVDLEQGTECVVRLEHSLFAVDIRIDKCTDQIEQVYIVDQSSRTTCTHMLDCLKAYEYAQFEQHLTGFISLRENGSVLLEAERSLSELCKNEDVWPDTSYWDLFVEPVCCPRVGGIAPKFYYFLSPIVFMRRCVRQNEDVTRVIKQEGYHFSLTTNDGLLRLELQPAVPCLNEVFRTLPGAVSVGDVQSCIDRRLWDKDIGEPLMIKVYKPSFVFVQSIALPQIAQIKAIVRLLRVQSFLSEILDLSELPEWKNISASDGCTIRRVEIAPEPDGSVNICLPPVDGTFPSLQFRYDGQNTVIINDSEKDKLEFVFRKIPSLISLLRLVSDRCIEVKEPSDDVTMEYSPVPCEDEVSLNAVFNSVIERFTSRSVAPVEEPPMPKEEKPPIEIEAVLPFVAVEEKVEEKVEEPVPIIKPKIKIKPLLSPPPEPSPPPPPPVEPPALQSEVKKKKRGRKPKSERLINSEPADESEMTKKVEPLRIKISALNANKRNKVTGEGGVKRNVGRKRLMERKQRVAGEKDTTQNIEIKEEKVDLHVEGLDILNDDKKKSSLSNFKIPRKKAPQEVSPAPQQSWMRSGGPQPIRYRPRSILSEPLPPTPQCYSMMDRSSSLSPQIGPSNRRLFPPAFQAPPASPRLRQPVRQAFSPVMGHPMDIRQPRYRLTRTGSPHDFRFR